MRTPRTPRSFDNPKSRAIGRKILSAGPAHLTMSEKDMDHMMMMMLHNAVTQVLTLFEKFLLTLQPGIW